MLSRKQYLTEEELENLTSLLEKHKDTRDAILIETLYKTGGRANEVLAIEEQDLYFSKELEAYVVELKTLKQRKKKAPTRIIPISEDLFRRIKSLCVESKKPFPISYSRLYEIWCHWRPASKKLHALRHTYATTQYKTQRDILLVKELLGHTSINTTLVYSHLVEAQTKYKKAVI